MAGIARSIRLLVGVAMVAGGATLAAPMVTAIVSLAMAQWGGHGAAPQPAVPPTTGPMPAVSTPMAQPPAQSPAPPPTLTVGMADPPPAAPPVVADAGTPPPALDRDYRPPSPPTPLPGLPAEFLVPGPQVGNAYRSTLEVPPPPLLDSQQPPPLAAAWSAHTVPASSAPTPAPVNDVPQTYRVKDGDDLTSIATRFYGHPGAAAMIWEANRGAIADPSLLPIGAELRLPAAWTAGGPLGAAATGRAIEPSATSGTGVVDGPRAAPVSWLGGGGQPLGIAAAQPAASAVPRSVRVAPGETLATLATRFYGDASQASRIWEANRDQLRSPELVVAGMELRLP
ncbi:MAG: hypothetical protein RLZZ21_359 [Planctomycetota bacterium]|jgi:nucleoid-associated protein YgaU